MTELDASRVPRHTGCGRWFDIRDLREVARDTSFQFIRGRWFQ
jgi:hypothetical protein